MIEELLVRLAEIIRVRETIVPNGSVLEAPAPAYRIVTAQQAIVVQFYFLTCEVLLLFAVSKLFDRCIENTAQPIFVLHEKIAAESIAVVFDNNCTCQASVGHLATHIHLLEK